MKLLKLIPDNFKGMKHFEFVPNGANADIYGDNATGKTTVADAYFWLLFGKDSAGRSDGGTNGFKVAADGTTGLDYSVTGVFLGDDGQEFSLRRVYKQVFTRKNGEAEQEYKGNTTDFYINDVPKPKKEYTAFVAGVCDEGMFMLLTDPDRFPGKMKWDERRDMLIRLFAADTDDRTIITAHDALHDLIHYIGIKSVDEYAAITRERRKKINKQLNDIPGRIDEAEKAKPQNMPTAGDGAMLAKLSVQKIKLESVISAAQNGEDAAVLRKSIAESEADIAKAGAEYARRTSGGNTALEAELQDARTEVSRLSVRVEQTVIELPSIQKLITDLDGELAALRNTCVETATNEPDESFTCPTCGQSYSPEKVEEIRAAFYEQRVKKLEILEAKGTALKETQEQMKRSVEEKAAQLKVDKQSLANVHSRLDSLQKQFITPPAWETTPEYTVFAEKLEAKRKELAAIFKVTENKVAASREKLAVLVEQIDSIKARMLHKNDMERQCARIESLKQEEQELSLELATMDKGLLLADKFVQTKAMDIEKRVNSAFQLVKWKLFDTQVNGGIKACCDATVDGIDYNTNLNSASKLNAGLDIINTLSAQMGVNVPIWIDNAESVTHYLAMDAQVIRLHVSADDKQLRTEVQEC